MQANQTTQTHAADIETSCPDVQNQCVICADDINTDRVALLKANDMPVTCLMCGEEQARLARLSWCIAPMHKSNYMLITNKQDLTGLNNKGGLVK